MFHSGRVIVLFCSVSMAFGQEYTATALSIKGCPTKGPGQKYEVSLVEDSKDSKSLSATVNLDKVFNKDCTYQATVDYKTGVDYIRYTTLNGNACEVLGKVLKPAWDRLKTTVEPAVKDSCIVNPGSYSLKGFQMKKDEFDLPIAQEGEFRVSMHLYCQEEELGCVTVDILVTED
ncbi:unnamed protein product [Ceutorhynchus assimilis]|uniref:MD-2-related lipid-recognition domain-containing protein n=1 Tax=Ceutorhynchus assimilis TaxID=467358 RepID=A0A9N9MX62_9CUCU|nr:unnamed protein product [Ceutorhynchus assimilis]